MNKIPFLKCVDCGRQLDPQEERWEHHTRQGKRIKSYCAQCMYEQVAGYAERTIAGMFDGQVGVRVIGSDPEGTVRARPRRAP